MNVNVFKLIKVLQAEFPNYSVTAYLEDDKPTICIYDFEHDRTVEWQFSSILKFSRICTKAIKSFPPDAPIEALMVAEFLGRNRENINKVFKPEA